MNSRSIPIRTLTMCLALFLCLALSTPAPSRTLAKPELLLKAAEKCKKSLYRSTKSKKYRHNWLKCIRLYENIYRTYPKTSEAAWALYLTGRMYTHLFTYSGLESDLDEAIRRFREVGDRYPKHRLADDAQYRIGEIYYNQKEDPTQAYVEFLKVDIKYPQGDTRYKARAMLDKISVVLAQREREKGKKKVPSSNAPQARVKEIRHWSTPNYTRVVIDLDRPVKYYSELLGPDPSHKKPRRLYVDLKNARVPKSIDSVISIKDGLLQSARAGQNTLKTVRVVLDIESIGGYKIFHLHDPFRIVVDVRGTKKNGKSAQVKEKKRRPRKGVWKSKRPDGDVSLARQLGLSVQRIVIDPGHGGKDPGTYVKGGIKEKDIVLKLAKVVAEKVESKLGCEAILTRNRDRFLSLEKRTAFANMNKADLFVSLHINAHKQRQIHGLETYYLNMATDSRAVMVAARENATSEKNISDLQTILNDLMLNTKISESNRLAHQVQKGMIRSVKGKYRNVKSLGVKQAPFYVLIGAEMPAVLIETGFITNPTEKKRLTSKKYLNVLADGIVAGIDRYIKSIETSHAGG